MCVCVCSFRTANSPCPVCLFTLLDAPIDRHFALSVQSLVCCEYLERDFIWIKYTLDVCNMRCSTFCENFIAERCDKILEILHE